MFLNCCHRRLSVHVREDVRDDHNQPVYAIFTPATWQIFMARCTPLLARRAAGHVYLPGGGREDSVYGLIVIIPHIIPHVH